MKVYKNQHIFIPALLLTFLLFTPLNAQEDSDNNGAGIDQSMNTQMKNFYKNSEQMRKNFRRNIVRQDDRLSSAMESQWEEMVKRSNEQREQFRKRVEEQWTEFRSSTNKTWVEYNNKIDTRSSVDFENGEIEIETLVNVDEVIQKKPEDKREKPAQPKYSELNEAEQEKVRELAKEKIETQFTKILSSENEVHSETLKDQIKDPEGEAVTQNNSSKYAKNHIEPDMKIEEEPVVANDTQPRLKIKVKIKMVPEHLKIRAEKYRKPVEKYAKEYNLDPALVFAVIHTESYFNPLAKSYVPAYGLMQLVPRFGAMDAYAYLYEKKELLPASYLYNPDNNIMLGATYLYLLQSRWLSGIRDTSNQVVLTAAAYNWGPTRIKNKIIKKYDINQLSHDEVVGLINAMAPRETRDYIQKIKSRMELYNNM